MHAESHSKYLPWAQWMNGITLLIKHLTGLWLFLVGDILMIMMGLYI